jgi:hypothetical protein
MSAAVERFEVAAKRTRWASMALAAAAEELLAAAVQGSAVRGLYRGAEDRR